MADSTSVEIEWMEDDVSPCCLICENSWNLKRRRHHCRNCGRLVCKECSNQKVKLEDSDTETKRVCDDCLVTIEEKKQIVDDGIEVGEMLGCIVYLFSLVCQNIVTIMYARIISPTSCL
jgi:hypothetical protein